MGTTEFRIVAGAVICCILIVLVGMLISLLINNRKEIKPFLLSVYADMADFWKYVGKSLIRTKKRLEPPKPPRIVKIDFWEGTPTWARRNIVDFRTKKIRKFIQAYSIDADKRVILKIYQNGILLYRWRKLNTVDIETTKSINKSRCLPITVTKNGVKDIWHADIIRSNRNRVVFTESMEHMDRLSDAHKIIIKNSTFTTKNLSSALYWLST